MPITPELLGALTPPALLMLGVLLFMLGWIVPRWVVRGIAEDRDARLADKDRQITTWQEAHRISELAREKEAESARAVLETLRLALDRLESPGDS